MIKTAIQIDKRISNFIGVCVTPIESRIKKPAEDIYEALDKKDLRAFVQGVRDMQKEIEEISAFVQSLTPGTFAIFDHLYKPMEDLIGEMSVRMGFGEHNTDVLGDLLTNKPGDMELSGKVYHGDDEIVNYLLEN